VCVAVRVAVSAAVCVAVCVIFERPLRSKLLAGAWAFAKNSYAPHGNQIEINVCCVEFGELSNDKSNVLVPGWGTGSPPPKTVIFRLLSDQVLNIFRENYNRNAVDIIGLLVKDDSITIDTVSQLDFFLNISWV